MSKERMIAIEDSLSNRGWDILNLLKDARYDGDLFHVIEVDEMVVWGIRHQRTGYELVLQFCLFDDLGRRTSNLNDILYCQVADMDIKLYFSKIKSKEWRTDLRTFIDRLNNVAFQRS